MRIALIGGFGQRPDEGMRKLCQQFEAVIRRDHEVVTLQSGEFCRGLSWTALRRFRPHCLHYLTGPTIFSLIALRYHQATLPGKVITVATGIRPYFGPWTRSLVRWVAPSHYLAQSRRWESLFESAGTTITPLPNGVDTRQFRPVSVERRNELKRQWGLPADRPVVLHVGHVKENRNLDCLIDVQRSGRYAVWIVGSESESRPGPWRTRLEDAGCRITTQFISAIEQVYQAADLYAFTVTALPPETYPASYQQIGVIDMPLSILEAMAAGLPVATTRHDAIERFCGATPGLRFFDGRGEDCLRVLDELAHGPVETRSVAERLDLEQITGQLRAFHRRVTVEAGVE